MAQDTQKQYCCQQLDRLSGDSAAGFCVSSSSSLANNIVIVRHTPLAGAETPRESGAVQEYAGHASVENGPALAQISRE
jgi:hypothetical protein